MVRLKPGDRVNCRLKDGYIVSPYKEYDEIKTFEIVATGEHGYYLYVPHFFVVKGTIAADARKCKQLGIDPKFLNEQILSINSSQIDQVQRQLDGMCCSVCHEFYDMAEPNQDDGTLICWSCRQNPYR